MARAVGAGRVNLHRSAQGCKVAAGTGTGGNLVSQVHCPGEWQAALAAQLPAALAVVCECTAKHVEHTGRAADHAAAGAHHRTRRSAALCTQLAGCEGQGWGSVGGSGWAAARVLDSQSAAVEQARTHNAWVGPEARRDT